MAGLYFPIKSGFGTRVAGGGIAKPSGSFATLGAAAVYDSLQTALGDGAGASDFCLCSHLHTKSYGINTVISGPNTAPGLSIKTVDDANMDVTKVGALETSGGVGLDLTYRGYFNWEGFEVEATDDLTFSSSTTGSITGVHIFKDGIARVTGGSDRIYITSDNSKNLFINTEFQLNSATAALQGAIDAYGVEIIGGSATTTSGGINVLLENGVIGETKVNGMDAVSVIGSLINWAGSVQKTRVFNFKGIKMNASATLSINNGSQTNNLSYMLATNCSDISAAAEYQYSYEHMTGTVEDQDDSGIHRDESIAYESGTKISLLIDTNAACSAHNPLIFPLPTLFAELSAKGKIRFNFASIAALTDNEFYFFMTYPDGTTKQLYNLLSNQNANSLGAGTAHTADVSSTWLNGVTPLVGYNEYQSDLDTSGDAGADSVPTFWGVCTKANSLIYLSPSPEAVA